MLFRLGSGSYVARLEPKFRLEDGLVYVPRFGPKNLHVMWCDRARPIDVGRSVDWIHVIMYEFGFA